MVAISAGQVKELRQVTGVGMMECKKALEESQGDMEKAILWLRERGMSRAAKKAGRTTAEGIVEVFVDSSKKKAVILEVNCETDFAAKNEKFVSFAKQAAQIALANHCETIEALAEAKMENTTVAAALTELIATVGENMSLRRLKFLQAQTGIVVGYIHMGGKIGTAVCLEGASDSKAEELGKDLAMHVAAASPRYLKSEEVSQQELAQEEELARKKLLEEGKTPEMVDKIMAGQMKKFFSEVCLLEQPFIKDPKSSITKVIQSSGTNTTLKAFVRFQLGEGIERKEENFAEEVAAQLKK